MSPEGKLISMYKLIKQIFLTFPPLQFDLSVSAVLHFTPPPFSENKRRSQYVLVKMPPLPLSNTEKS